jgi:hypothetical protein
MEELTIVIDSRLSLLSFRIPLNSEVFSMNDEGLKMSEFLTLIFASIDSILILVITIAVNEDYSS